MLRYRLLISLFACLVVFRHGRARLTVQGPARGAAKGPHVWLHGASNGELASVRPILEQLTAARPDLNWLVTVNTQTARDMVAGWDLPRVQARIAPVDLSWVTDRVIKDWQVVAHISLEAEIWPHRVLSCPGPVILLGARMSESTAKGWRKLGPLTRRVMEKLRFVSPQDDASGKRFLDLGVPVDQLESSCDLKAFYDKPDVKLHLDFTRHNTWLAASTHEGEEEIVLAAHKLAREAEPDLKLILAPRHPRRASAVRALVETSGLTVAQRSVGENPAEADVYLADTMGEMGQWYASAGRVFVGGSIAKKGGHTPYEPAAFGAAVLHGPDRRNFRAAYDRLHGADAAREAVSAAALATALNAWSDPAVQRDMGQRAQAALKAAENPAELSAKVAEVLPKCLNHGGQPISFER